MTGLATPAPPGRALPQGGSTCLLGYPRKGYGVTPVYLGVSKGWSAMRSTYRFAPPQIASPPHKSPAWTDL